MNKLPVLNGLVLAGGKSIRMGKPKEKINWHGKEQRYYVADLLAPFCDEVYISCRQDHSSDLDPDYLFLSDTFSDIGPLAGLLSAFKTNPDAAWIVVACDLPLLDNDSLEYLIKSRNTGKIATAYRNPSDHLPEPLITIWEPKSYPILNGCLVTGNTSLRKTLINNDIMIIHPLKPDTLLNVNTPEELLKVSEILKRQ
ncbi:NTP transferase domain-containing protein [Epilithonimonas sp. JDS]|uniref:NTP transferase domain-containing protein n=1 Tax=Epilithonimonas sp. JDS TaxID=2902797 RepID=UPI001E4111E8|nr:NTP transferase domain-containing protein [Epilithonimonas sp. JDS]